MRVVLATGNAGKLREFAEMLGAAGLDLEPAVRVRPANPPRKPAPPSSTTRCSRRAMRPRAPGLPAMADDSGLEVDALGGAPGVRSARYAAPPGSDASPGDAANIAKLLRELHGVTTAARGARFRCVIALRAPRRRSGTAGRRGRTGKAASSRRRAAAAASATTRCSKTSPAASAPPS